MACNMFHTSSVICFVISSCETAEDAMKFFGEMRTHNGKVIDIVCDAL